ncbi:MAG TPA: hypothetical protein VII99_07385 [Bacteroidia bacterium]
MFSAEKVQPISDSLILSVEEDIDKAIAYLLLSQIKKTDSTNYYEGEWPSYITNTMNIPFLGKKGKGAYDSNCFTTTFIHNVLAEIVIEDLRHPEIIPVLEKAQKNILLFKTNYTYNFWHLQPRAAHLQKHSRKRTAEVDMQRRANHFFYKSKMINRYENIYDDADDTSAGWMAMYFSNEIKNGQFSKYEHTPIGMLFSKYRDVGKRKTNWYNRKHKFNYRTGAYLTWFGQEKKHANFFNWFFPDKKKQNILYGRNEIDCVVNANVIRSLALFGETNTEGFADACAFVNAALENSCQNTCGVYYPTEFTLHYSATKAISSGAALLEKSKDIMLRQILSLQREDGSWQSELENNDIQATLYAVNSLLRIGECEKNGTLKPIEKAMQYIRRSAIHEGAVTYWLGGVFFSGGSAIRYAHVWRSDALTTALAVEALTQYRKLLEQQKK